MDESIEEVEINGKIFVPKYPEKSEDELYKEKKEIERNAIKNFIEEKKETAEKMSRCKLCKCFCGCHPCKHTK